MKHKINRGIISILLFVTLTLAMRVNVFADEKTYHDIIKLIADTWSGNFFGTIELTLHDPNIVVDGESKEIDPGRVPAKPIIKDNRTIVPVRKIVEEFGGQIFWEGSTRTVSISDDDTYVEMKIGSNLMKVNNRTYHLDTPPIIIGDRTYLPLRAMAESLNCEVEWDESTEKISLTRDFQTKRVIAKFDQPTHYTYGADKVIEAKDNIYIYQYASIKEAKSGYEELQRASGLAYAEPDVVMVCEVKNNPMDADIAGSDSTVNVAVISNHIDSQDPILSKHIIKKSENAFSGRNTNSNSKNYGTLVSKAVVSSIRNADVNILPINALIDIKPNANNFVSTSLAIASSIDYAVDSKVDMINVSLYYHNYSPTINHALTNAHENQIEVDTADSSDEDASSINEYSVNQSLQNSQNPSRPRPPSPTPKPERQIKELRWSTGDIFLDTLKKQEDFLRVTAVYSDQSTEDFTSRVRMHSDNPEIATIDENGHINAVSSGTCYIYLENIFQERLILPQPLAVHVYVPKPELEKLHWSKAEIFLNVENYIKDSLQLIAVYSDGSTKDVTSEYRLYSDNPGIADVDEYGVITAISKGSCRIFLDAGLSSSHIILPEPITVYVEAPIKKQLIGLKWSKDIIYLDTVSHKEETLELIATYSDGSTENATSECELYSDNTKIANINEAGKITAIGEGSCNISIRTAFLNSYIELPRPVTVYVASPAKKQLIALKWSKDVIYLGTASHEEETLELIAIYSDGSTENVTRECKLYSDDPQIASISANGKITAKKMGNCNIYFRTVVSNNYIELPAPITVYVNSSAKKQLIELKWSNDIVFLDVMKHKEDYIQLLAIYSDGSTEDVTRKCQLYSDNPEIIKVEETGKITAMSKGQGTISFNMVIPRDPIKLPAPLVIFASENDEVTNVKWSAESLLDAAVAKKYAITAIVQYKSGDTKDITPFINVYTGNAKIAAINQAYQIEALSKGMTYLHYSKKIHFSGELPKYLIINVTE